MKTEFDIGQEVWIIWVNEPMIVIVKEITVSQTNTISYIFKTLNGISLGSNSSYKEEFVGATKEELKNKIFK